MSLQEEAELLRQVPLFADISPAQLKLLAFASERIAFEPGQVLFNEGEAADAAYVIVEGEAEVLVAAPGGAVTVARLSQRDFVGEIGILCEVPRTATVRATTRLATLKISKELFFKLVAEFPNMALAIMRELGRRIDATNKQLLAAIAQRDSGRAQA